MPELPDLTVYVEALSSRLVGEQVEALHVRDPFLLRTVDPDPGAFAGREVRSVRRVGKRIAIEFSGAHWAIIHLMISGRLQWAPPGAKATRRALAVLHTEVGSLSLTEAGSNRRASLHLASGSDALVDHDPGGLEVLDATLTAFTAQLVIENHTLKRALTDPRLFSGIGNAYSDEILHQARLSPVQWTSRLSPDAVERLFQATQSVLGEWTTRLRTEVGDGFPRKVTAFRPEMAVHGKYGAPCPACGTTVQRIRYAETETNYCPRCQTDGRVLADRSLSRLLKADWPRRIEEWEALGLGPANQTD